MKVFKAPMPKLKYNHSSQEDLSKYSLDELRRTKAEAVFYWYIRCSYEGSGQLLLLKDRKWYLHSMEHCSCFSPIERIDMTTPIAETLAGVRKQCSAEYWKEVEPLVILAEEKGYGAVSGK
jgi:hypothetical protein